MTFHLWFGAAIFAAAFAPSSSWGGEGKDTAVPNAGVPAQTSRHAALRTSPVSAQASAASKPRKGQAYLDTQRTFAGISRGTKAAGNANDDWSTGSGSKPSKGKAAKKDPPK